MPALPDILSFPEFEPDLSLTDGFNTAAPAEQEPREFDRGTFLKLAAIGVTGLLLLGMCEEKDDPYGKMPNPKKYDFVQQPVQGVVQHG